MSTQQQPKIVQKISNKEARNELWRRGNLRWLCHDVQKEMYDVFYNSKDNSKVVWLLARQSGKSFLLAILALEQALRKKDSVIKIVTDTKMHIKTIFDKIFVQILETCPEELKPEYKQAQFIYYFPNGSQIHFAGTDNKHYEKLRGTKSDLALVDESGFCSNLTEVVNSVLLPTTTHTGGKIVMATTPPRESDHEFFHFLEQAELELLCTKKTIYDNPLVDAEQIERLAAALGGKTSEIFRREYLCEIVKDSKLSVVPEFTPEIEKEVVKEWPEPPFYDSYVSMDLGFKDLTVVLFGYFDFRADKVIFVDEIVKTGTEIKLKDLTDEIDKKEIALWTNKLTNEVKRPSMRVSDINYIVTQEIYHASNGKINFLAAKKDNKFASINTLRTLIAAKKIIIDPKCKILIRHLRNVKWASTSDQSTFARSPDDSHYDAVDAALYMIRSMTFSRNPFPAGYDLNLRSSDMHVQNPSRYNNNQTDVYRKIFGIKRKK